MRRRDDRGQVSLEYAALIVFIAAVLGVIFAAGVRFNTDAAVQRSMCRIFDGVSDCGAGSDDGGGPPDGSDPGDGSDPDGGDDPDDPDGTDPDDPDGTDPDDPDGTDPDDETDPDDPDGGDDSDEDGNGIDDDMEDEAEDMAEDLAEQMEEDGPGFFEVNSFGECAAVSGNVPGVGGTLEGCLVYDGDVVAILGAAGGGVNAGSPGAGVMAGPIITNAETVDQLTGPALCVGGSFTSPYFVGGGGDVCFGIDEETGGFSGIWTLNGGVTAGVPGGEGHFYATDTAILAEMDVPDIPSVEEIEDWVEDRGGEIVGGLEAAGEVLGDVASEVEDTVGDIVEDACDAPIYMPVPPIVC